MGAFATQFEVALKEQKFRQVEVAQLTGGVVSQTMVSRYMNGAALPELDSLERLVKIFPDHTRERLVTAYLLDHIPPSASHLVTVQPASQRAHRADVVYGKAVSGSELAKCLAYLEERALQSPTVADGVIATVRAMRGDAMISPRTNEPDETFQPAEQRRDMPLFGTVPAGRASDNPQQPESYVQVPVGKYPTDAFGLRVQGDSMIGKKIFDGDIVVVHRREAKNGDVVVALIDGETTLKTLVSKNGKCKLRSENPKHKNPILTDQSAIQAVMIDKL